MKLARPGSQEIVAASRLRLQAETSDLDELGQALCEAELIVEVNSIIPEANTPLRRLVFSMAIELLRRQTQGVYILADLVFAKQVLGLLVLTQRMCSPSIQLQAYHLEQITPAQARRMVAAEATEIAETVSRVNREIRITLDHWRGFRAALDLPVPRRRRGPPLAELTPPAPRGRRGRA